VLGAFNAVPSMYPLAVLVRLAAGRRVTMSNWALEWITVFGAILLIGPPVVYDVLCAGSSKGTYIKLTIGLLYGVLGQSQISAVREEGLSPAEAGVTILQLFVVALGSSMITAGYAKEKEFSAVGLQQSGTLEV